MSSLSKKRKEPPQSTTLLSFFNSKTKSVKSSKPRGASTFNGYDLEKSVKEEAETVIVIDSDEEALAHRGNEEVVLEDGSSDVEIVEITNVDKEKRRKVTARASNISCASREIDTDATFLAEGSSGSKVVGGTFSFGKPSSLLLSSPSRQADSIEPMNSSGELNSALCTDPGPLLQCPGTLNRRSIDHPQRFETPITSRAINTRSASILSEQLTYPSSPSLALPPMTSSTHGYLWPSSSTVGEGDVVMPVGSNKGIGAELYAGDSIDWEMTMGDDEVDLVTRDSEYIEEQVVDLELDLEETDPEATVGDQFACHARDCPVCGQVFVEKSITEFEAHVNRCLDNPSTPSRRETSSTSKTLQLQPLSSLRQPHFTPCPSTSASSSNAFSVLMSSHDENAAWDEAQVNEDRNFRPTKANGGRRKAPFYKVLQGMPIAVDAFRYGAIPGVTAYFLTHAHSDHYTNLSSNWKGGPIYCSETTANLVVHMLSVDKKWVHPLPMNTPMVIPNTGDVQVTLIEANHCPGSCLFLFEGRQTTNAGDSAFKSHFVGSSRTFRYLHCGDFRACPQHVLHPAVKGKKLDHVYLDTTYLDPKYCFPPQPMVVAACAELAKKIVFGDNGGSFPALEDDKKRQTMRAWITVDEKGKGKQKAAAGEGKVLVVIGTYSIGKERVVKAVANALQTKIYCDARKTAILLCESDPELHALLTNDPFTAGVHVVPLGLISSDQFGVYMDRWKGRFSKAVGFRPTGWTYTPPAGTDQNPGIPFIISRDQKRTFTHANLKPMRNSTTKLMLYGVPYSEHSSFFELTCFALSLDWVKMIATVNVGSQSSRAKISKWVEKWEVERKRRCRDGVDGKSGIVPFRKVDYW